MVQFLQPSKFIQLFSNLFRVRKISKEKKLKTTYVTSLVLNKRRLGENKGKKLLDMNLLSPKEVSDL